MSMIERTIPATTHGRYLVVPPASPGPAPVLVGFHGYAEGAEAQLDRMRAIPGAARWLLISIQGLNRFYQRRSTEVIAGWMTRQHRDLAIHDNIAYVASVVDLVCREWPT
ncbi:MAG: phospholipase, partial [Acidobacteria bacterium]